MIQLMTLVLTGGHLIEPEHAHSENLLMKKVEQIENNEAEKIKEKKFYSVTKKINFISIKIVLENRTFKFLARQDNRVISDINNCLGDKNSLGNSLGLEILTFCLGRVR